MRALALLVALAGCGRLGFGGNNADSAIGDGVLGDGAGGDAAQVCSPVFDICDGFESGINTGLWSVDSMVTLDTTRAHRGINSVRAHTPAFAAGANSYQSLFESQTIMTSTTFWVRGWFWLSALPATGNGMELITAERPGSNGDYVFIFSDSTHLYTQFGNDSMMTSSPAPVGSWFCVVWKVVRSSTATGSLDLTGDLGALSLPSVVTDSSTMPMTILTIGMGFAGSNTPSAQPAIDLWIDDIIVHSGPVTCAD